MADDKPATIHGLGMDGLTVARLQKGLTTAHLAQALGKNPSSSNHNVPASSGTVQTTPVVPPTLPRTE